MRLSSVRRNSCLSLRTGLVSFPLALARRTDRPTWVRPSLSSVSQRRRTVRGVRSRPWRGFSNSVAIIRLNTTSCSRRLLRLIHRWIPKVFRIYFALPFVARTSWPRRALPGPSRCPTLSRAVLLWTTCFKRAIGRPLAPSFVTTAGFLLRSDTHMKITATRHFPGSFQVLFSPWEGSFCRGLIKIQPPTSTNKGKENHFRYEINFLREWYTASSRVKTISRMGRK